MKRLLINILFLLVLPSLTVYAIESVNSISEKAAHRYDKVDSVDELWSIFVRTSLMICQPDSAQLRCPPRMHIRPLVTSVLTDLGQLPSNENVSPHCFRNDLSRWKKDPRQLDKLLHKCRHTDSHEIVRHLCEGRNMCRVSVDRLFSNRSTDCAKLNIPVKLEYKCLPDPNSASFEAICADTYMEVKCDSQLKGSTLVILTARLEKQINVHLSSDHSYHKAGCPTLPAEHTTTCSSRIDVTRHFQSACDGRSSCSVSPSMADSRPEFTKLCGKMHLSLTYVCVPSETIVPERRMGKLTESDATGRSSGKGKKNQRQPKGVYDPKSNLGRGQKVVRPDEAASRDTRQLLNSPLSEPAQHHGAIIDSKVDSGPPKSGPRSPDMQPTRATNPLQPLFIALGVGLLILMVAMTFVIVACRRKTRSSAGRKRQSAAEQTVKHGCCQRQSFWSTTTQPPASESWGGKKQPCSACYIQPMHSSTKLTVGYDPCPTETCRCGLASSAASEGPNVGPVVELQESFHPCCNPTRPCSSQSSQPRFPISGYGLPGLPGTGENYSVNVNNVQYVVGLHGSDLSKGMLTYPDQHSLSQSNSSSSGVGVNSAQLTVYGSPYPLGPTLGSPAQPGARIESVAYSTGHKESPVAESSSGRGCDGGSGTSEPSEAFHFTCPRTKPGYHAIANPLAHRPLVDYLPIPAPAMPMNASDYVSRIQSQRGSGSPYDAASARSLSSAISRPGQRDVSPRPNFRSPASTEQNFTTFGGYFSKSGTDRTTGLNYMTEQSSTRETYDHVSGYHQASEPEHCSQTTLHRRPSQCDQYIRLPAIATDSTNGAQGTANFDPGSSESLTVPLLEPPSNFRSPVKGLHTSEMTDYIGLDPEDMSTSQSSQKPPDVILKSTTRNVDGGSADGIEQPPPPIAPLRVFQNSNNLTDLGKDSCYFSVR